MFCSIFQKRIMVLPLSKDLCDPCQCSENGDVALAICLLGPICDAWRSYLLFPVVGFVMNRQSVDVVI